MNAPTPCLPLGIIDTAYIIGRTKNRINLIQCLALANFYELLRYMITGTDDALLQQSGAHCALASEDSASGFVFRIPAQAVQVISASKSNMPRWLEPCQFRDLAVNLTSKSGWLNRGIASEYSRPVYYCGDAAFAAAMKKHENNVKWHSFMLPPKFHFLLRIFIYIHLISSQV